MGGELRTAEPLVGRRSPLIACGRDRSVTHSRVDRVVLGRGSVERDAGAVKGMLAAWLNFSALGPAWNLGTPNLIDSVAAASAWNAVRPDFAAT